MKVFIFYVLLVLSISLVNSSVLSGAKCVCPDSNCQIVTVSYNNKSSSFQVNSNVVSGTKLIIQQQECNTCGYMLEYVAANFQDTSILTYVDKTAGQIPSSTSQTKVVGGNNVSCFTFNVLKTGTANIPFFYYRPWERANGSRSTIVVSITNDNSGKASVQENTLSDSQILTLNNSQSTKTTTEMLSTQKPNNSGSNFAKAISKMFFIMLLIIFY